MNPDRSVSLIWMLMTMDCPRCGFTQPRDQFCAQCGLNVEAALKQRPVWWRRVAASPRLYVGLVGLLLAALIFFFLGVNVPRLFRVGAGDYVSSRDAATPNARTAARPDAAIALAAAVDDPAEAEDEPDVAVAPVQAEAASQAPEVKRFDTEFWEIAHDQFLGLIEGAERVAEDNAGRAFVVHAPDRVRAALKAGARPVGAPACEDLRPNAQTVIETPPGAGEGLRFGLAIQLLRWDNGHANLRLNASLAMSPPETPAEIGAGAHARAVESGISGAFELTPGDVLILLIEPTNRRPRADSLSKAGAGPWQILGSPNFRVGETDWIATVRLK
jgi:hypothetical protein